MGNCQCQMTEAATVIIQHPGGKVDRLYWPASAAEVMKNHPGHFVALVTLYISENKPNGGGIVRFTRVKLLKPKDTLLLGRVYRLITSQEVTKALGARKNEKIKNQAEEFSSVQEEQPQSIRKDSRDVDVAINLSKHNPENKNQDRNLVSEKQRSSVQRGRQWRPSLQSIEELGSLWPQKDGS